MKKFLLILLSLVLAFTAFSGCSGSKEEKLNVKLTLWHYYNDVQKVAFDKYIIDFNDTVGREKGITIEAFSKVSPNDLAKAVIASANKETDAEAFPDMFLTYPDTAKTVDKLGMVAALDDYFTAKELSEYVDGFIEEGRLDSSRKLKTFPIAKSIEIMILNKTDWDKFVTAAKDEFEVDLIYDNLKTIEGVIEVSELYYNLYGKAFYGRDSMANYMIVGMRQLGIELFSVDAEDNLVLNLEKSKIRQLWDNYYVPYLNGYFIAEGKYRTNDLATNAIIAAVGSSSSPAYAEVEVSTSKGLYEVDYEFLPAPIFATGSNFSFQQGAGFSVAASDEVNKIKGCVEFLKWFTEVDRNIKFAVSTNYIPVKKTALNWTKIEEIIVRDNIVIDTENPKKDANAKKGLQKSIEIMKESPLYVNKPFVNGNNARNTLEDAYSKVILNATRALVVAGSIDEYVSDSAFDTWYANLSAALEAFKTPVA